MKGIRAVYEIARADFLQRIRQKGTLVAIIFMMYFAYLAVPDINASYYNTLYGVDGTVAYRGIYNSYWTGFLVTYIIVTYITLIGFFLTKNTVSRDRLTKVGDIIASSKMNYKTYLFGKTISNILYLLFIIMAMVLVIISLQLFRQESTTIDILAILMPIVLFALPAIIMTSILSVVFESRYSLQGIGGGLTYFFLWVFLVILSFLETMSVLIPNELARKIISKVSNLVDVFGINKLSDIMVQGIIHQFPNFNGSFTIGSGIGITEVKTFVWENVNWDINYIIPRIVWLLVAILVLFIAAIKFDRKALLTQKVTSNNVKISKKRRIKELKNITADKITRFKSRDRTFNFLDMIIEEINLNLRGVSIWWFIFQGIFILNIVTVPKNIAFNSTIPAAFIVPIFVLAKAGTYDRRYKTESYMFAIENYKLKQLVSIWVANFTIMLIVSSSTMIKVAFCYEPVRALYVLIGVIFITSLAVFLGTVSGNSTLFELIYIVLWYAGPLNKVKYFDFLGVSERKIEIHLPITYLLISLILIAVSVGYRLYRVRNEFE